MANSLIEESLAYLHDRELIAATAFFCGASMVKPIRFIDAPIRAMTVALITGFIAVFATNNILMTLASNESVVPAIPIVFSLATMYNFFRKRKIYPADIYIDDDNEDDQDQSDDASDDASDNEVDN